MKKEKRAALFPWCASLLVAQAEYIGRGIKRSHMPFPGRGWTDDKIGFYIAVVYCCNRRIITTTAGAFVIDRK